MKTKIIPGIILMFTLGLFSTSSMAQSATASEGGGAAAASSEVSNTSASNTQDVNITFEASEPDTRGIDSPIQTRNITDSNTNVRYSGEYTVKSVPDVSAPGLTTTLTETCMGSTSAGGAVVGFGFSFGTTWRDSACVRRLDARQVNDLGYQLGAKELMCDSPAVRKAMVRANTPCFADLPEAERAAINPLGNEQVLQQEWDDWQRSEQGQQLNNPKGDRK